MAISIDVEVHLILSSSILQMKISSPSLALSWAALVQALLMRAASLSSLSPRVLITSGCCFSSNIAFFQSILGWKAANQGYPKTNLSSPMWVTRKRISSFLGPTCTCMRTHFSILRCAPWPLGLHLLKIQLLGELPFSVPPHEIKLLIFW